MSIRGTETFRKLLAAGITALGILTVMPSGMARDETPEAFVSTTFAEAQALAAKDNKVVFVDFFATWCGPCKMLDQTTWKDPQVIALLREKTVALRLDAEKDKDLARKYRVEAYPTLLVLKADGTEIDRYVGYMEAAKFREALTATLAGKTSLQQARDAMKPDDSRNPSARMKLARQLTQAGQYAEALEHLLWCYDHGTEADPAFVGVANSFLPAQLGQLARKYPPAVEALKARRDPLQAKVLADPKAASIGMASRLAGLDLALKDDDAILATLSQLPEGSPARKAFGNISVVIRLAEKKKYREALSLGVPEEEFKNMGERFTRMSEQMKSVGRELPTGMAENMRKSQAMMGMMYTVILAGAGEMERARKLAEATIAVFDNAEIRSALAKGLREAGAEELARIYEPPAAAKPAVSSPKPAASDTPKPVSQN